NTATISWTTDEKADSRLEYGLDTAYGLSKISGVLSTTHTIVLDGLNWDTTYYYCVGGKDASGNIGWSVGQTFKTGPEPDTTPPRITAGPNVIVEGNAATITWNTDEPATSIIEYGTTTGYGQTNTATGYHESHQIVLTGLMWNTRYHYRIRCADMAGNTYLGPDRSFTTPKEPDTTPPTIVITSPQNNAVVWGEITIEATATDNHAVDRVEFYLDNVLTFTDYFASYRWKLDTTTLPQGAHTIRATATDKTGNTASAEITITIQRPNTPPTIQVTNRPPNKITETYTITGTISDPDNDQLVVEASLDNGPWTPIPVSGGIWTYNIEPDKLEPGTHTLRIRAWDGEEYSTTQTITFTTEGGNAITQHLPPLLLLLLVGGGGTGVLLWRRRRKKLYQ
ncbi:MAG: Ig-like domain-containing protein, partial [Candidatus Thermoplasmatota archaeon]|nr:Ig-like domain-containing protein [Candidatus Thermoplasmatota archaeon]